MAVQDKVVAAVAECPRCKAPHERVPLKKFEVATRDGFDWYGECPQSKQPITAKVTFTVEAR